MTGRPADPSASALLADRVWQMSLGERLAVEGLLSATRPGLAVEIGTAEGASARRIAMHAGEVHSFDLHQPPRPESFPEHVRFHTGDSHELLRPFLADLAKAGRTVDFALIDGDHSAAGVQRDLEDLLNSTALALSIILIHDSGNPEVRRGLDAVRYESWPSVAHVELDLVPGQLGQRAFPGEIWGGLGLVLVGPWNVDFFSGPRVASDYVHHGRILELAARGPQSVPQVPDPATASRTGRRRMPALIRRVLTSASSRTKQ